MRFEELDKRARLAVMHTNDGKLYDRYCDFFEETLNLIQEVGEIVGIDYDGTLDFNLYTREVDFSGYISYKKGWKQEALKKLGADDFYSDDPISRFFNAWEWFCKETQQKYFYKLEGSIDYHFGNAKVSQIYLSQYDNCYVDDDNFHHSSEIWNAFSEILEDFKDMALALLRKRLRKYLISLDIEYDEYGDKIE